jgi:hypothetical protein
MKNNTPETKEDYLDYYNCFKCPHRELCEKEYGSLDQIENCSAVVGTHFCRRSWDGFECCCRNK